jgi:hypothetical protein
MKPIGVPSMIQVKSTCLAYLAMAMMALASLSVKAEDEMKPFILASVSSGNIADSIDDVKSELGGKGFEVVG